MVRSSIRASQSQACMSQPLVSSLLEL